jgi:murein DD-endopeptidase MepM/ murein hydrolase activator NlpD
MKRARFRGAIPVALFASFVAGALVDGWLRTYGPPKPVQPPADLVLARPDTTPTRTVTSPAATRAAAPIAPPPVPSPAASGVGNTAGTMGNLSQSRLRVPIDGEDIESLKGAFAETRDGSRPHEAVDMLAPRNTPIHAVENGTIAKLFTSKAGGLTIYQFDPGGRFCYYYAHLERYAEGLKEGQAVSQGDVIGYVGTSGNAPANTPHLHFAVFELNADKHWWQGKAIDPYQVFKSRG